MWSARRVSSSAEALGAKRLCCVLGARGLGKSSLLQRAARALRDAGTLVATVDLRPIAEQTANAAGGLRAIAERIAAESESGVDVGEWWGARSHENRLVEFFWEIVLTNTTAPIVVLVDELDAALDLEARGGAARRRRRLLCASQRASRISRAWVSRSLAARRGARSRVQAPRLRARRRRVRRARGFFRGAGASARRRVRRRSRSSAQALMDRVWAWTGGHPYLTQRVARGVARKGGRLEDVEHVVREQLLAPGAADRDSVLGHVRVWLGEPSRVSRRAREAAAKSLRRS